MPIAAVIRLIGGMSWGCGTKAAAGPGGIGGVGADDDEESGGWGGGPLAP